MGDDGAVIEILTFALADGADEAAFVGADARVQAEFAYRQPGLVRRTTARADDGRWAVVTLWASADDAESAVITGDSDPAVRAWAALVDPSTRRRERYTPLPG